MTVNTAARQATAVARRPRSLTETRIRPLDIFLRCISVLAGAVTLFLVAGLIVYILAKGLPGVTWKFLTTEESALNRTYGILPNIINTAYIIVITLLVAAPLGVGGAIYLNEYAKRGRLTKVIEFTTEALAGIPSIIYGLFGMMVFNNTFGFGYSIISGCLTLAIMVLPTIIRTTQEALRTVPTGYREGAAGLGASKWHTIRTILIPCCKGGIITSLILSIGRIVGESAALIFTAGIAANLPSNWLTHAGTSGATFAVQLYQYADQGRNDVSFAIAAVLILVVLAINLLARLCGGRKKA
ncbi:MAG TPA: phosphate ABC transporter permease PstA [Candidatus Merdivicinus intestinavium]|nr:phosphate ABC transporter permease PstA [Candidatus Merdivicinus intestinavium]